MSLAGGGGTLDELFEVFTWFQLGLHQKPIALINTRGYWQHLLAHLDRSVSEGFIGASHRDALWVDDSPEAFIARLPAPI